MAFFESLKMAMKEISDEVKDLKKVKPEFLFYPEIVDPTPNIQCLEPDEIKQKQSEMEAKIRSIRIATSKMKINFKHKQDISKSYFLDVEDLYFDILDEYKSLEKRLVKFGYCPCEVPEVVSPILDSNDDKKKIQQVAKSVTPKLALKKFISVSTPELHLSQGKNKDKTPELCLEEKPKVITKSISTDLIKKTKKYGDIARRLDFE